MTDGSQQSRREMRLARLTVLAGILLLGLWISAGFLPALVWGIVIAIAIDPLHLRLRGLWPSHSARSWVAAAITLIVALCVLLPIAAGLAQAAREAHDLTQWIAQAQHEGVPVPLWVDDVPFASQAIRDWWTDNLSTPAGATEQFRQLGSTTWLAHTQVIGRDVLHRGVIFAFTLLVLFFALRERDSLLAQCRIAGERLLGASGERIGLQAVRSVRGTIDGLVLVGIGEGAVMTIVYVAVDVPHPLLFGVVTAIAAMIPFGAAVVFAIAGLLLLGMNAVGGAIAVIVIGLLVVAVADHFVRPILIGGATRLPFLWVLVGILGGVEAMGLLGLFVGPATMAVLIMLWRDFLKAVAEKDLALERDSPADP